jgi:hypothetical protein
MIDQSDWFDHKDGAFAEIKGALGPHLDVRAEGFRAEGPD